MQNVEWHLIAGLVKALDWFDNSLQNVLASQGFTPVHRTQSLILVHIASGVRSPADIAREMGLTRQNVHQMTKLLIDSGLVEQRQHPDDPRRIQYGLTESSAEIRNGGTRGPQRADGTDGEADEGNRCRSSRVPALIGGGLGADRCRLR